MSVDLVFFLCCYRYDVVGERVSLELGNVGFGVGVII